MVVDCASRDDTVAVARTFADAVVVALGENAGFGRANNRGLAEVSEPVTVLVNPDVELLDDSLRALAAQAARHPDRLLAPLVLYPDGRRQDTVHPAPASPADLVRALIPGTALAAISAPAARWLEPWRSGSPRAVGWAVGCAIAARTDTLRRLGPFDEAIFLYGEDMELGLRAAASRGSDLVLARGAGLPPPGARLGGGLRGRALRAPGGARQDVVRARLGARRAAVDDALQALTFGSRIALKWALGGPRDVSGRSCAAVLGDVGPRDGPVRRRPGMRRRGEALAAAVAVAAVVVGVVLIVTSGGSRHPRAHAAPTGRCGAACRPRRAEVFGINVNRLFNDLTYTQAQIDAQLAAVRATGATVARSDALWEAAEPHAPAGGRHHYDWSFDDQIAGSLAAHGLTWLPIIDYTAPWAQSVSGQDHSPPRSDADYAAYAGAFAARYGSGGTFWRAHPGWRRCR